MARREIQDLLRRYRRIWRRRRSRLMRTLRWTKPGTVWAVDFSEPPQPIEGTFTRLLAVRDLASGYQLAWLPIGDESAATAISGLEALFRQHGAPLVLKSDNGSAFVAEEFSRCLGRWEVAHLLSPVRMPRYNGACEAGIGSMKARTHHAASTKGRAADWTCDDVEAARLAANQTARPWGIAGPTPEEAWAARGSDTSEERVAFLSAVRRHDRTARAEQGYQAGSELHPFAQAAVSRVAIRETLAELGLLQIVPGA
jgi:transposase InsO family protein